MKNVRTYYIFFLIYPSYSPVDSIICLRHMHLPKISIIFLNNRRLSDCIMTIGMRHKFEGFLVIPYTVFCIRSRVDVSRKYKYEHIRTNL